MKPEPDIVVEQYQKGCGVNVIACIWHTSVKVISKILRDRCVPIRHSQWTRGYDGVTEYNGNEYGKETG